jgi:murein DD-endopeptidase MepM/ murein hydrolase activator NlpD
MKNFILTLSLSLLFILTFGQTPTPYDKTNFRSPLGIELILAGNFAEVRTNHYHTGIDIKTNGKEGYKIYAIDSGYISRINISHYGYGNAIYVVHPNGYTSVYAHLSKFPQHIEDYIRKKQFEKQSETVEVFPGSKEFIVSKGDVIAFSGNSGSSTAPHLHFEIRESGTEKPVNPLLFGFDIKDDKKPILYDIKLYPFNGALIDNGFSSKIFPLTGSNGNYQLKTEQIITCEGSFGVAINTIDLLNAASNKCGIYTIELMVDKELIFKQKLEKLSFTTNRYINTSCDYTEYKHRKQSFHKSFLTENNKLDIYEVSKNKGRIEFEDTLTHILKYIVKDVYGNTSTLSFKVKSVKPYSKCTKTKLSGDNLVLANEDFDFKTEEFETHLPKNTVYEDMVLEYKTSQMKYSYAPLHHLHNDDVPVQQLFVLKLKTKPIDTTIVNKAVVVEVSKDQKKLYAKGGEYKDGWVTTQVKSFGNYTVRIDSIPPVITPVNIKDSANLALAEHIQFKISDNLSGIKSYDIFVDGNWKLAFYNIKTGVLTLPFEKYNDIQSGTHTLKIVIKDERKNVTEKSFVFIR